jgi:hypothetical protein
MPKNPKIHFPYDPRLLPEKDWLPELRGSQGGVKEGCNAGIRLPAE